MKLRQGLELGEWKHLGSVPLSGLPSEFYDGRAAKTPGPHLDKLTKQMKKFDGSQS